MSSYKTLITIFISLLFFTSCASNDKLNMPTKQFKKVKHKKFLNENQYIVFALESESFKDYHNAKDTYKQLFLNTNNYEYFTKYLQFSFFVKDYTSIKQDVKKYLLEDIKEEEEILMWYVYSLSTLDENEQAIKWAKYLLSKYENAKSYEILAKIYYDAKDYEKSYENFKISNSKEESIFKISTMANLKFNNLDKKNEAKEFLKQTIELKEYDYTLSLQLITYHAKDKEFDELTNFLKELYLYYDAKSKKRLLESVKKLFVSYSFRYKDVSNLIDFLEEKDSDDMALLALYEKSRNSKKVYEFLLKAYEKEKKIDYLGQIAVLEFEMAEDKKAVLNSVIEKFNEVLKTSTNAKYQNYLAYLLIDYDLDVKRAINLVNKALKQEPTNIAYLDTLAWGEYKLNNCKKAYKIMDDIVKKLGLNDEEIKLHWEKIKECIK